MEELFQRAAEGYPLDPGPDDWQNIAAKINAAQTLVPVKNTSINVTKILLLTGLILLLSAGFFIVLKNSSVRYKSAENVVYHNANCTESKEQSVTSTPALKVSIKKNNKQQSISVSHFKQQVTANKKVIEFKMQNSRSGNVLRLQNEQHIKSGFTEKANTEPIKVLPKETIKFQENALTMPLMNSDIALTKIDNEPRNKTASSINKTKDTALSFRNSKSIIIASPYKKSLYLSVIAGADFSKVKSGPFNNIGVAYGLIAELKFTKVVSLQSGIIVNKKNYIGEGVVFNIEKVRSMMAGMTINNVESKSTIIEIPVAAKFYFKSRRVPHFFIAPGISAYILTKERNLYHVDHNGLAEKLTGFYPSNTFSAPAVAIISAGYQTPILKHAEISIAPYLHVPLRGVGIGKMPVTSAGFRVSIGTRLK